MKIPLSTILFIIWLFRLVGVFTLMIWDAVMLLANTVYSDDDEPYHDESGPYYNYHTGEMDPVKYWNGMYDEG